jgi:hypothetical protein
VDVGFADARQLTSDDDLKPLHNDLRFQTLLDQIKRSRLYLSEMDDAGQTETDPQGIPSSAAPPAAGRLSQ